MAEPGQKQYDKPAVVDREVTIAEKDAVLKATKPEIPIDPKTLQKIKDLRSHLSRDWERGRGYENQLTNVSFAETLSKSYVENNLEDELRAVRPTKREIIQRIIEHRERLVAAGKEIPSTPEEISDDLLEEIFYNLDRAMPFKATTNPGPMRAREKLHSLGYVDGRLLFDSEGNLLIGNFVAVPDSTPLSEDVIDVEQNFKYAIGEKRSFRRYKKVDSRNTGYEEAMTILFSHLKEQDVVDLGAGIRQNFLWAAAVAGAKSYAAVDLPPDIKSYGVNNENSKGREYYNLLLEILGVRTRIPVWRNILMDNLEAVYTQIPDNSTSFVSFGTGGEFDEKRGYSTMLKEMVARKTKIGGIVATLDSAFGDMEGVENFEKVFDRGLGLKIYRRIK